MVKELFKKIIIAILTFEARLVLRKYSPKIVAITGTVGKTSSKEAVVAVLGSEFYVRGNKGSYNSEIGVPLTVLGLKNAYFNLFGWIRNIFLGAAFLVKEKKYPRVLVLEFGADKPGDIERLTEWIKPDTSVLTALSDIPVHIEFFANAEHLWAEKAKIFKPLKQRDTAILNYDDPSVLNMKEKIKAEIITFGFGKGADVLGSGYKVILSEGRNKVPQGINFKIEYKGAIVPVRIYGVFGKQQMYACLAATAVGISFGLNLVKISEALTLYKSPPGRLKLLRGIKDSLILDDTYNASPVASAAALEVLKDLSSKRKIAVLGDMLELGKYTVSAHKDIGVLAASVCDLIFLVGMRSKFIKEGALEAGFSEQNIFEFRDSREAALVLQSALKKGDLVLVKGSQSMRMERAVEEVMVEPEEKEKLLIRQDEFWRGKE